MEDFYTDYMIVACKFHFFSFFFLATKEDFKISRLLQRTAECKSQITECKSQITEIGAYNKFFAWYREFRDDDRIATNLTCRKNN